LNRLRSLVAISTATSQLVVSFAYALGPTGNRTQIVEHDGTTRDYQYDDLYRLTDEHVTLAGATRWHNGFAYDPVGNRLRQDRIETTGSERVVLYDYDERDRLLTESSGDATLYGWDENGNQISKSGPQGATYEWDFENRLRKVSLANGTVVEHDYDVDGTRIRTRTTPPTGPPTTIDDLVDPYHQTSAAGRGLVLSQVVVETDAPTGALAAYHVRGDDLLATLRPDDTAPTTLVARYFHAEGIGTVRALTDEAGAVSDRYELEAFGELLAHDGDDPNSYLFAGESREPNDGLYYLRARWLGTSTQAFISLDPVLQFAERRDDVLPYVFASSDPVNRGDPTGLSPTLRGPTPWAAARVGSYVHHRIGIDFRGKGPNRYANYTPIWQILGLAGPGECRTSALFCRLKPDLVDGHSGEVYEIKPFGFVSPFIGYLELSLYLATLEANDFRARSWLPGATYQPPRHMFVPILGGWDVVILPPLNGVIAYQAISRIVTAATISGLVTLAIRAAMGQAQAITAQAALTTATSRGYF
jgi:RHS repeat-associated protein